MSRDGAGAFLGIDVGGTFTDLIWQDRESGEVTLGKGRTSPDDVATGVCDVIATSLSDDELRRTSHFLHANTVGLNALLERKGAVVGLLTTAGFRDVLEIRRGDREAFYDVLWRPSEPLVPRSLRLPVRERVLADGSVVTPLQRGDVLDGLAVFREAGVECVAVVYINAHANSEHEVLTREILLEAGYDGEIALSHELSGEYREFERTATTVVDAYVRPSIARYLRTLDGRLRDMGFGGGSYASRSGGGVIDFAETARRPFEAIISGPAAGVVGAAKLSSRLGLQVAITADVGGTSFDTSLVLDGEVPILHEGRVGDLPLQTSWVDVRSIGAGGGSLARVDAGGLLRVGPESAGAVPGPACYGRGGTRPTVTDAAASLGMLADGRLAAGVQLDLDRARAVMADLGAELGLGLEQVATGVLAVAAASMANAIQTVTVQKGIDPRTGCLIAFGGAGPLMAVLLARELAITDILVPRYAGAFSAWGLLTQDLVREASLTRVMRLDPAGLTVANEVLAAMFERLESSNGAEMRRECALDCRYAGQEYTLTVGLPSSDGQIVEEPADVRARFVEEYRRAFGYELTDDIEIVSIRATLRRALGRETTPPAEEQARQGSGARGSVAAWSFANRRVEEFVVVERDSLGAEETLAGPAIVRELTATTYLDRGFRLQTGPGGHLVITKEE